MDSSMTDGVFKAAGQVRGRQCLRCLMIFQVSHRLGVSSLMQSDTVCYVGCLGAPIDRSTVLTGPATLTVQ